MTVRLCDCVFVAVAHAVACGFWLVAFGLCLVACGCGFVAVVCGCGCGLWLVVCGVSLIHI